MDPKGLQLKISEQVKSGNILSKMKLDNKVLATLKLDIKLKRRMLDRAHNMKTKGHLEKSGPGKLEKNKLKWEAFLVSTKKLIYITKKKFLNGHN